MYLTFDLVFMQLGNNELIRKKVGRERKRKNRSINLKTFQSLGETNVSIGTFNHFNTLFLCAWGREGVRANQFFCIVGIRMFSTVSCSSGRKSSLP